MTDGNGLNLFGRMAKHGDRKALIAPEGTFNYARLRDASAGLAGALLQEKEDLLEERVAFLVPPGSRYAATLLGIWQAGGMAVPLAVSHPRPELEYVIDDADASLLVAAPEFEDRLRPLAAERNLPLLVLNSPLPHLQKPLPRVDPGRRAMMVYTSGTTGRPKGVVTTHHQIESQITPLVSAWGWVPEDHILHVLPLHHVHGIVNVLLCALWTGAVCEILPRFDAEAVWDRLGRGELSLFMAVPTIYSRLIAAWEGFSPDRQKALSESAARLRLMVSGSAALPVGVLEKWKTITGHLLLERYGMTEIGMALSNPLDGERRPGHVGQPLPGVETRIVDEKGRPVAPGGSGELQIKGPAVFLEYWRKPEATAQAFVDGWFRTGDVAEVNDGSFRLMGRSSVDIIKTGGYKVSALDIEEVLRQHPDVAECAVVGVSDEEWGQRVGAALILKPAAAIQLDELRSWARERLAPYKIPSRLLILDQLPRNAMGKVTKPEVMGLFESRDQG